MADNRSAFEARLAEVFDRYADRAPVEIDPWIVAQAAARSPAPGWRSRIAGLPGPRLQDRGGLQLAIALALVGLLLAAFAMAMWVGGQRHDPALLTDPARPLPKASPANADLVAFTDGKAGGLYVHDMRSREVRVLDPDASSLAYGGALSGAVDGRAVWSPDRQQIAYFADRTDGPRDSSVTAVKSLRVVRVADGESREVAKTQATSMPWGNYEQLAWSPNGSWIATPTSEPWPRYRLMLVNADEPSRSTVLSSDDAPAPIVGGGAIDWSNWAQPDRSHLVGWSPSGQSLALVVRAAPGTPGYYAVLVDADGSGSRAVELPDDHVDRVWWLDEEHLLLKKDESLHEAGGPPAEALSVLDLGSGDSAPFATDLGADPRYDDLLLRFDPAVSPDRGLIAFYGAERGVPPARIQGVGLFVIDAAGRLLNQIAVGDFCRYAVSSEIERINLDFSASGREILMDCRANHSWALADLDSGRLEDVELGQGWANW